MTNQELDKLMAEKVMGWKFKQSRGVWCRLASHGRYVETAGLSDWHPTESISDAFQVVDKMAKKGFKSFGLWNTLDNQWRASFSKQGLHCDIWADSEVRPLAICLAAKKAIEQ